jgi:putative endonuclease
VVRADDLAAVYVVGCRDGSLYCGFARDLDARLALHNAGRGARYTRARRPVALRWAFHTRAEDARRLEGLIKRLPRPLKERLIRGDAAILGPLLLEVAARRRR